LLAILRRRESFPALLDSAAIFLLQLTPPLQFLLELSSFLWPQGFRNGLRTVNPQIISGTGTNFRSRFEDNGAFGKTLFVVH